MDLGSNGVGEEENSRATISSEGDMVERMDVVRGEIITNDGERNENMDDSESEKILLLAPHQHVFSSQIQINSIFHCSRTRCDSKVYPYG